MTTVRSAGVSHFADVGLRELVRLDTCQVRTSWPPATTCGRSPRSRPTPTRRTSATCCGRA
ncbi:MAG: hypothetical protein R2708_06415 [Vicinamibacterales bacterium]